MRYGLVLPEVLSFDPNPDVNITKIILTSDSELKQKIDIFKFKELEELQNAKIIYGHEMFSVTSVSKYYFYETNFNHGVFNSFCIQISGGPIFSDIEAISYYGIVTKEPCGKECNIGDNGYTVGYVKLYDYYDWIFKGKFRMSRMKVKIL